MTGGETEAEMALVLKFLAPKHVPSAILAFCVVVNCGAVLTASFVLRALNTPTQGFIHQPSSKGFPDP